MARKQWQDLTTTQQRAIIVGGAVEAVMTAVAVVDLCRRPDDRVRGSKVAWLLVFVVQPFGPLAYFRWGRR